MSFFEKLMDFVSGGIGGKIVDTIAAQFPPDMSEKEKEEMKLVIAKATHEYELELMRVTQQEQEAFTKRVMEMEGTATDLKQAGSIGRIVLFLRGLQRPLWGFSVLYMDFMVFSGTWDLTQKTTESVTTMDLQSAFWIINFLVLGFLFGERAMRNVMPFFRHRMGAAQGTKPNDTSAVG
jgi:hypothetical protein